MNFFSLKDAYTMRHGMLVKFVLFFKKVLRYNMMIFFCFETKILSVKIFPWGQEQFCLYTSKFLDTPSWPKKFTAPQNADGDFWLYLDIRN